MAKKDEKSGRAKAASKILDDMATHSPVLVEEALLISEELNRTAIMIKEKWYEGIHNAWNYHHSNQNSSKGFISQLQELHDMMKQEPQSSKTPLYFLLFFTYFILILLNFSLFL